MNVPSGGYPDKLFPMQVQKRNRQMVKTFLRHIFNQSLKHCRGLGLGRFRALRLLEKTIRANLITDFAEVMGHQMYLDPKDTLDLSINGVYEPFETSLVLDEVREGEVVLDIGAHIGYYTLIFAKLVGPLGKVFAFEPELENFAPRCTFKLGA